MKNDLPDHRVIHPYLAHHVDPVKKEKKCFTSVSIETSKSIIMNIGSCAERMGIATTKDSEEYSSDKLYTKNAIFNYNTYEYIFQTKSIHAIPRGVRCSH